MPAHPIPAPGGGEPHLTVDELYEPEWVAWFALSPAERWAESARMLEQFLARRV